MNDSTLETGSAFGDTEACVTSEPLDGPTAVEGASVHGPLEAIPMSDQVQARTRGRVSLASAAGSRPAARRRRQPPLPVGPRPGTWRAPPWPSFDTCDVNPVAAVAASDR